MSLFSILGGAAGFMIGGPAGAAIGAGIVGGIDSSNAASSASDAQVASAAAANKTQQAQYDQTRADNAPWRAAGGTAIGQLAAGTQPGGQFTKSFSPADFQGDPGYAFRLQQGQNALDNSAAARGGVLSGAQLKASSQYNQGFASNEYGNAYNRFNTDQTRQFNQLSSVAGTGQVANGVVATAGTAAANQISGNQTGAGNAQASGYVGSANGMNAGIAQGVNSFNQGNALSNMNTYGSYNNFGGGYSANGTFQPNTYGTGASQYSGSNALSNGGWGIE